MLEIKDPCGFVQCFIYAHFVGLGPGRPSDRSGHTDSGVPDGSDAGVGRVPGRPVALFRRGRGTGPDAEVEEKKGDL